MHSLRTNYIFLYLPSFLCFLFLRMNIGVVSLYLVTFINQNIQVEQRNDTNTYKNSNVQKIFLLYHEALKKRPIVN